MKSNWLPLLLAFIIVIVIASQVIKSYQKGKEEEKVFAEYKASETIDSAWVGLNKYEIPTYNDSGKLIMYGYNLVANTSYYLGPKGIVAHISNGMNCQNCHLDAGTKPWGNNYGAVYATYPQFRARSNSLEGIYSRVNDCFERSLNGQAIDTNSREMKAIYAYMKWLGNDLPKGKKPVGTGIMKIAFLDRAADPVKGKTVFMNNCQSCHGVSGEGQLNVKATGYIYPPLWGEHSYNDGAGLFRISSFAGYVKNNMPQGTDYHNPKLSDEEAWDVAAFVNSQYRPHLNQSQDWKNILLKPFDFPFGPYADNFSEAQHKFGPFQPIKDALKDKK
jgi:thiosulfate dehydrogenase